MAESNNNGKQRKREPLLLSILKAGLFGRRKGDALSLLEEEQIQSPGKTIAKEFFKRKLTIVGLVGLTFMVGASIIIPIFFPVDLEDRDTGHVGEPPSASMMRLPRQLRGNVSMLDAGPGFGVGVNNDNEIFAWGNMGRYRAPLRTPPVVNERIIHISAGLSHALVVTEGGNVHSWGDENVAFAIHNIPPQIQGNVMTAEAGWRFSLALDNNGRPHVWGNPAATATIPITRLPMTERGVQVEVNWLAPAILTESGRIYVLLTTPREFREVPEEIQGRVVDFALTEGNGGAVLDDGSVVVWGDSTPAMHELPAHIQGRAVSIGGGREHFTVLLNDGTVTTWGSGIHGTNNYPSGSNFEEIFVGFHHNYALTSAGSVSTWGLAGFFLGTDGLGRDIFRRLWQGGRYSLTVGAIAVLIAATIGVTMGGIAGFFSGPVDMFIMRFAEALGSIPFLPLAMIIQWTFGHYFGSVGRLVLIMVILGVLTWPGLMRLVRGLILQSREAEYVIAARALGVKQAKIIFRHIMPNIMSMIIVWMTVGLAGAMLTESTLSFLGFGVAEPRPTWGNMLMGAQSTIVLREQWWRWIFPAASLLVAAMSINLIGDGLREAADPRTQGR